LAGDTELAGDLSLTQADGEQLGSAKPASLEAVTYLLRNRTARNGLA
jgi:hypothetical protein